MRGRLLLALGALVFFVLLVEGVVRVLRPNTSLPRSERRFRFDPSNQLGVVYHDRDDHLGWRLKPNQSIRMNVQGTPDGGFAFHTNAHGLRGRPFEIEKAPGVIRILIVGDSNAMGYGVASDEAIYSRGIEVLLNRHFEDRGLRFEAINMGVDGYSSHQARLLVERYVKRMSPDFVCVQVGFNDHCLSIAPDRELRFDRPLILDGLERSMAYRFLRRQLLLITRAHERTYTPVPRVSLDEYESNVRSIVRMAGNAGAETLLLTTPARVGHPLAINEVPVTEGGETIWMTETSWTHERLREAGIDPPDQPRNPRFLPVIEAAITEHTDWATLHFMRARALFARGDSAGAEAARALALQHDDERAVLDAYMERLARVAASEPGAGLLDVGVALRREIGIEGPPPLGESDSDLFIDFVPLGERGQVLIAKLAAEAIAVRVEARHRRGAVDR